jgi:hypothetical protein
MKFTIFFNESSLRKQHNLLFDETYKKAKRDSNKTLFWSILIILFALSMFFFNDKTGGVVFLILGGHFLVTYVYWIVEYLKAKKKLNNYTDSLVSRFLLNENDGVNEWELDEEFLSVSSSKALGKISWDIIKGYKIIDDHIMIIRDVGMNVFFIIGKQEVSDDVYQQVIQFLETKIKNLGTNDISNVEESV